MRSGKIEVRSLHFQVFRSGDPQTTSKRNLRTTIDKARKSFLLFAVRACLATALRAALALVAPPSIAQTRSSTDAVRITQPIDETDRVTLKGNVYPAARPRADQGVAPASLPLDHMVLLLRKSKVQQAGRSIGQPIATLRATPS
jgi:hypothetical protein